ncbi:TPA: leucine--tRNA ligase [Candidatus Falkowbacteria bacterium]|nr:MAG: Leucine-tRNA ligase [Candidatus Falkowbacteria bacterium GW2011_GWF2_43_32]HBA36632.1 leucine--tRNA ligase [Candidatus Falkowbacteria bacterium]
MYNHQKIEKKWREIWADSGLYKTGEDFSKPKYYVLDMFPYPSGVGLHVGHPKGYIATDILARLRMMQGYNVLHPMGFDAFGLPAENYALKNKLHPQKATETNIAAFKKQLAVLGFSYDWAREVITTDPQYYRWTQWIFLQMWKKGLAFESHEPINWCPSCQTGLANEDLEEGKCERCGSEVEQRPLRQWVLRITEYAERLLNDLEKLGGWEESIKEMQRNWIGRSEGAEIIFRVEAEAVADESVVKVFTTRLDTIFGCTYVVLAPEHKLINELKKRISNWPAVEEYIAAAKNKTDLQRTDLNKEKTGVILEGVKAINPFNNEPVAIFVADYVLNSYGTGAIMAVPAHDERDYKFAEKYGLEFRTVVINGLLQDSGEFSGLSSAVAVKKMIAWLEKKKLGARKTNYKIKDWVFSRQRYWGEPIPLIHCSECGVVPVPEKDLPVRLPEVDSYEPTGTGESPLALIDDWVNVKCPKCGGPARRETNTMPQWAGSCWYYLRYIDPNNDRELTDKAKEKYWSPVDFYVGGAEHATRHLIYARFWHKVLYDLGVINYEEPFIKFKQVGLIIGADGRKMSKRWGNVINPDDMAEKFGADALRVYEMFMGPFEQAVVWNTAGLVGTRKFLEKVLNLAEDPETMPAAKNIIASDNKKLLSLLHKTIKKVGEDIENFNFNTAVSALMILINELTDYKNKNRSLPFGVEEFRQVLKILAPFAPHLAEELWEKSGGSASIFRSTWPKYDREMIKDETINLIVQVNGKLRATWEVAADISEKEAWRMAQENENIRKWLAGKEIVKNIFVPGKLLNIVVK